MKFRILRNCWWMFWAGGMVGYPFIFFRMRYPTEQLFKHELMHCYQVRRMGILKFYFTYVLLYIRHGYNNHPYEKEAREYARKPLNPHEQVWFAELKNVNF